MEMKELDHYTDAELVKLLREAQINATRNWKRETLLDRAKKHLESLLPDVEKSTPSLEIQGYHPERSGQYVEKDHTESEGVVKEGGDDEENLSDTEVEPTKDEGEASGGTTEPSEAPDPGERSLHPFRGLCG